MCITIAMLTSNQIALAQKELLHHDNWKFAGMNVSSF